MHIRHLSSAGFGVLLILISACDSQPETAKPNADGVTPLAKLPHPEYSRKSTRYSPTAAAHVSEAKVLAVDDTSITLFLDTNYFPLDVKGWQIRQLPVVDMLAKGDIHEWAGDRFAYGLADVQIGDIVEIGLRKDEEDNRVYVHEICIEERPGGLVPPSRRPGHYIHCPPDQLRKGTPYHAWKNVQNDLEAGRPVPDEVLRMVGKLPPLPPPNAAPDQLPPARQ